MYFQMWGVNRLAAVVLLLIAVLSCSKNDALLSLATNSKNVVSEKRSSLNASHALPDFTQLVDLEGPAVVNINASKSKAESSNEESNALEGNAFDFYHPPMPPNGAAQLLSLGSGFLITDDGYILTNAHVVNAADKIAVKLSDGRSFQAKLIGLDLLSDIAMIKINGSGLPKVAMGDPSKLHVGEWVAAIGSPFGFENSVTAGIVSAKGRSLPGDAFVPFIQTDVAVNPGNSGGPLFNLDGEVIGINSQIYSQTGGYMGVSFSIPIDVAMDIARQLKKNGKVSRGQLGLAIQDISEQLAGAIGLEKISGALIIGIEKNGPADKGGVQVGDVVLKYNQQAVPNSFEMRRLIASTRPGGSAAVEVWRKGQKKTITLVAGEMGASK